MKNEKFFPYKVGILVISDRASGGEREDKTAERLKGILGDKKFKIEKIEILPDNQQEIEEKLVELGDQKHLDLILTTGGTGIGPRDVTPEATLRVIDKEVPGIAEYMRSKSAEIVIASLISRAVAGIRGHSLIVNLPGSPRGASECLELILPVIPHALEMIQGKEEAGETMHGRT